MRIMISVALKLLVLAAVSQANVNISNRIIGGYEIPINIVPYNVQITFGIGSCTGTILSEKFVATAAHCIYPDQETFVRAGTSYFGARGQFIKAKKVIKHPNYEQKIIGGYNDYGLIVLEKSLVYNDKVRAIPMAQDSLPEGTMMLATGWGMHDKNDHAPSFPLRAIQIPIISDDVCKTLFNGEQHDSILCAGTFDQGKSVYEGDSGGPLVYENKLYGLTSFGIGEKVPNYPAGFARISYGYDWFMKTMEENKFI